MTLNPTPCVYIVDDDRSVLNAFSRLLATKNYEVRAFESARAFLAAHDPEIPGCAVLDVGLGDFDGLTLQEAMRRDGHSRPVVFITGHDDTKTGVKAMKGGAFDYLMKPVTDTTLFKTVEAAIEADLRNRAELYETTLLRQRLGELTAREVEVMGHVLRGRLNKQIAFDLGIVEKTVKVHRARVMEKMQVRSVAALVHMADRLGLMVSDRDS